MLIISQQQFCKNSRTFLLGGHLLRMAFIDKIYGPLKTLKLSISYKLFVQLLHFQKWQINSMLCPSAQ